MNTTRAIALLTADFILCIFFVVVIFVLSMFCADRKKISEISSYDAARSNYLSTSTTQLDAHSNDWELLTYIGPSDTTKALAVVYKDEIGFSQNVVYCMVVWTCKKTGDLKCTAPWIDKFHLIKKSNILDLRIDVVTKSDIKGL
jgi:hypothetical protein